jgi:hypothetical protein
MGKERGTKKVKGEITALEESTCMNAESELGLYDDTHILLHWHWQGGATSRADVGIRSCWRSPVLLE